MSKRRVTLTIDEDLLTALQNLTGRSMSASVNDALRDTLERQGHHRALLGWLDALDAEHGAPTDQDRAAARALLAEAAAMAAPLRSDPTQLGVA